MKRQLSLITAHWDGQYPTISAMGRRHWEQITPLLASPPEIRKIIYTTNAVESLHMSLRKVIKTRGSFPSEEAAMKLLYLALRNVSKQWGPLPNWKQALHRFGLLWEARFSQKTWSAENKCQETRLHKRLDTTDLAAAKQKQAARKRISPELFPAQPNESVYSFSSVDPVKSDQDAHVRRDLQHALMTQKSAD